MLLIWWKTWWNNYTYLLLTFVPFVFHKLPSKTIFIENSQHLVKASISVNVSLLKMFVYLSKIISFFITKAASKCKLIHDLIYEPREKLKCLKIFLSAMYGGVVGLLIYLFIVDPILPTTRLNYIPAFVSIISCAILCSISLHFRCISVLMWLEGLGMASRSLLKAIVIALVLLGPIANIVTNAKECARVFECTAYLTYNLTRTRFDLAVQPFTNAFTHMNQNLSEVKQKFHEIEDVMKPIYREIEVKNR